jgi:hypothetical protein
MVLSQVVGGMRLGLPTQAGRHAPSLLRGAASGRSSSSPAQRKRCCGPIRAVLAPAPVQQQPPQPQQVCGVSAVTWPRRLTTHHFRTGARLDNGSQMLLLQTKCSEPLCFVDAVHVLACNTVHERQTGSDGVCTMITSARKRWNTRYRLAVKQCDLACRRPICLRHHHSRWQI